MLKKLALKALPSLILLVFISCESCEKKQNFQAKKNLTIGITQEPDSLFIPFKQMMASEEIIRAGIYTLTYFDENRRLVPWVAKEIPTRKNGLLELYTKNGVAKMRTTWRIRNDFFWPDGRPLSAEDFVFTHKLYMDPSQEILDRSVVELIETMEALGEDKKILRVTWKQPYAYYHNYSQHEALPKHIIEPLYDEAPDQLKKSRFGQNPSLAGSFTMSEWSPGSHLIAKRNAKAPQALSPWFDQIIWRIIPQSNTLESSLVSGSLDAISPTGLSLDQALKFEERHKDRFNFYYVEGLVWEHIDFNLDNPILQDKRVRRALAYASDRQGITQALFLGRQPLAHGTEPAKSLYYNKNIKTYNFDPVKARVLLEEAGWLLEPGKTIREKNHQPLVLTLMSTSGDKTRERIEQLLQQQWRDVGVDIRIKNEPAKVFFGETMRKRRFTGLAMYSWIKDPLKISDTLWRCDNIPKAANNFQGQNMPGWCDKQADAMLKEAARELDENKRIKIGQDFEALFAEELPALPLYFRMEVSVTQKNLKNWKPTGTAQPVTWNAHLWHWQTKL